MARKSALILSAIALFMSLGGVSYAVGKATIGSPAVKDNSLRGKDIRNGTLRGPDVVESSLGTVPSAQKAQTADSAESAQKANSVDGMNLAKIDFAAPTNTATKDVLSIGGMTIQASCSAAGNIDVQARSDVQDAMIHVGVIKTGAAVAYSEDDNFDVGQAVSLTLPAGADNLQGTFTFAAPNGSVVSGTYLVEELANGLGSQNDCFVKGTITQG
jgi:hypothetical protein